MNYNSENSVFISLLRGINVGKHNLIRMNQLKAMYESLDLLEVHTYIQSGNVIFKSQPAFQENLVNILSKQI